MATKTGRWNHNIHYHPVIFGTIHGHPQRALDIGCGEGALARELRAVVPQVTAIDTDPASIDLARQHDHGSRIDYLLGDFLTFPFEPNSFDVIASVATLHHMDAEVALVRMRDLLRPGGTLAIIGLARLDLPADLPFVLASVLATQYCKITKTYWEHPSPTIWPPPQTYAGMRLLLVAGGAWSRLPSWTVRRRATATEDASARTEYRAQHSGCRQMNPSAPKGTTDMATLTVGTENSAPIELYYEDHGSGRPVVLIHGWPLSGRSWENQVPALIEAGYRVITYDRRGFGKSSQPWEGYDYDTFTADLHALLEHLDVTDATLVGFSMGGGEVVRYVAKHGNDGRVSKAVLAAAVPPYLYKSDDNPEGGLDDATIEAFQGGITADRLAFLEEFTTNFFSADGELKTSQDQRLYAKAIAAGASPKGTLDCVTAFGRTDFREDVAAISIPTLVIHGDADAVVPFEVSGRRSAESIKDSELAVIAGGPHAINATHVAQFNKALLEFLAK